MKTNPVDKLSADIVVTVLGSGTCAPSLARSSCSVLVETGGRKWLIDSGAGTLRRLLEAGTTIAELSCLLYSHLHPDHTSDLVPLLFATKYPDGITRREALTIVAGRGFEDFFHRLKGVYGHWIDLGSDMLRIIEMSTAGGDHVRLAGVDLHTAPVEHSPQSVAFRMTGPSGRKLVYSGDTDYSESLIELARGADLLICESAFPESQKVRGHLTPAMAGDIAARAGVRRLMLTHFYPACEQADIEGECRRTYGGPLVLAQDLMRLVLD
jgi:ribonuclease BN (tRNA processing enzyme)